ncbi:MAG TPA: histidine kinase, partial [Solirubrobacteraceae bacterium]|nr:histidine kinase [Solirubrobacteraceae bacterium]
MPRRADMLAGFVGAMLGVVGVAIEGGGTRAGVAAALLGAALCLSRPRPPVAWVAACGAMLVLALDTHGLMAFVLWLLVMGHAFAAGRWGGRWWGIAGLVAFTGSLLAGAWITGDAGMPAFLLPVTTWAAGRALADREQVAERLAERARELEAERDAHARLSVRYERARIAAELHDIVAHALSVMVIQAGAGQRLVSVDRELTTETFAAIATAARHAEADMRRLVVLLGDETGAAPDLPLVEELV